MIRITIAESNNITTPENILVQGTKNMSLAKSAQVTGSTSNSTWLHLMTDPPVDCVWTRLRVQAMIFIEQPQNTSGTSNYRFEMTLRTSQSVDTFVFRAEKTFALGEVYVMDEEYDLSIKTILEGIYLRFRCYYPGSSDVPFEENSYIRIYSVSIDAEPIGCDGVQVQSLDGRLTSTHDKKTVTYPILCLGRPPVRGDAQGLKEVLVFVDRATTLRVLPQPILLSEENEYAQNASVESNGRWALYDYDVVKLRCTLESGLLITGGMGNDILQVRKHVNFQSYGLYDLALLFLTDTSDEPYIVPVVLDYAVPLTVEAVYANGETTEPQEKKVTIRLTVDQPCVTLHIVRDRYWQIVGFPHEELSINRMEGERSESLRLCIADGYVAVNKRAFSFIVRSGVKLVRVNVDIVVDSFFEISNTHALPIRAEDDTYVLLTHENGYEEVIYLRQYWGTGQAELYEYTISALARHHLEKESITYRDLPVELQEAWNTTRTGVRYDKITIRYVGDVLTEKAGGTDTVLDENNRSIAAKVSFTPNVVTTERRQVTCYRNIELHFEVTGVNNRPDDTNSNKNWSKIKTAGEEIQATGSAGLFIQNTPDAGAASFSVRGNNAMTYSGEMLSGGSLTYESLIAGQEIVVTSPSTFLNAEYVLTVTFTEYRYYVLNQRLQYNPVLIGTNTLEYTATKEEVMIDFLVRHPHFLKVNNAYLQWDNHWEQHHWVLTNPDAEIAASKINVASQTGRHTLVWSDATPGTGAEGGFLMKFTDPTAEAVGEIRDTDVYNVTVVSSVPSRYVNGTWLSSPERDKDALFKVAVYYPHLTRNEIVPLMESDSSEKNINDAVVPSSFTVQGWDESTYAVFNRDNREEGVLVSFTEGRGKLRSPLEYDDRTKTFYLTVTLDRPSMIRSWGYTVQGIGNLACGFLIEGRLDGVHEPDEWETISAVTEFDTVSLPTHENTVSMDYVTVRPRPWSHLRITVTQVRSSTGARDSKATTSGSFKIGQFQFYTGYPVLGRVSSTGKGNVTAVQRNTNNATVRLIASHDSYVVGLMSDGRLFDNVEKPEDPGIAEINTYTNGVPPRYWNYQLVDDSGTVPASFASNLAYFGILLEGEDVKTPAVARIIGVRYDTGIVPNYSTASALVIGTSSSAPVNSQNKLDYAALGTCAYEQKAVISAWRCLGLGVNQLLGMNSLNLNTAALNAFVKAAQKAIFGDNHQDAPVAGTIVLHTNSGVRDFRLLYYTGTAWINIGQDIIYDTQTEQPSSSTLLSGSSLETIAENWWGRIDSSTPIPDKVAFTNPTDQRRLLRTISGNTATWADAWPDERKYHFEPYKGRQYYRSIDVPEVRSLRIHIPGLADTYYYGNGGLKQIRSLAGDVQLFEQFRNLDPDHPGVDITYQDVIVVADGQERSVKYGERLYVESAVQSIKIRCLGMTINGNNDPDMIKNIYAQTHHTINSWSQMSSDANGANVSLESNFTATSVTLFYHTAADGNVRRVPFFTLLVLRPE